MNCLLQLLPDGLFIVRFCYECNGYLKICIIMFRHDLRRHLDEKSSNMFCSRKVQLGNYEKPKKATKALHMEERTGNEMLDTGKSFKHYGTS